MVVIIISAALTSYCLLLLVRKKHHQNTVVELVEHSQMLTCAFATQLFALLQVLLREPLCLHWLHKVEFHFSKASSAEVSRSAFQFCFYLNPGPLMFGRGVDRFGGHRHQRQLGKRVADCSSVAAGRLSHRTSLPVCVCAWGGGCWYVSKRFCHLFSQATGPFLQFGAVGALTLLSPVIFRGFRAAKAKCRSLFSVSFSFRYIFTVISQCGCCFC